MFQFGILKIWIYSNLPIFIFRNVAFYLHCTYSNVIGMLAFRNAKLFTSVCDFCTHIIISISTSTLTVYFTSFCLNNTQTIRFFLRHSISELNKQLSHIFLCRILPNYFENFFPDHEYWKVWLFSSKTEINFLIWKNNVPHRNIFRLLYRQWRCLFKSEFEM